MTAAPAPVTTAAALTTLVGRARHPLTDERVESTAATEARTAAAAS